MVASGPRYKVIREIGRGAFGVVMLAYDNRLERNVALKTLSIPEGLSGEEHKQFIERFYREARAAAGLSHPNIVIIHDIATSEDKHFISMEYLDGQPLSDVICRGPIELPLALKLADQMLSGLAYAHSKGVVHRDIKPENVFLLHDYTVKIVDFGLARVQTTTTITKSGVVVGTPGYISPEVIRGKQADSRSDIFSFGATFYEMLTGKRPFGPDSAFDTYVSVIYRIVDDDPEPLSSINPSLPRELDVVIAKCLAKDPADRALGAEGVKRLLAAARGLDMGLAGMAAAGGAAGKPGGVSALEDALLEVRGAGGRDTPLPEEAPDLLEEPLPAEPFPMKTPFVIRPPGQPLPGGGSGEPAPASGAGPFPVMPVSQGAGDTGVMPRPSRVAAVQPATPIEYGRAVPWRIIIPAAAVVLVGLFVGLYFLGLIPFLPRGLRCPDLKGKAVAEADKALKDAGLTLGKQSEDFSDKVDKGKVLSQNPGAGSGMKKGASVAVTVSKGRETGAVPDLSNKPGDEARATLEGMGFRVNKVDDYSSTVATGSVIYQDPRAGTVLANGTAVIIVVSAGPRPSSEAAQPGTPASTQPGAPGSRTVTCSTCGGAGKVTCSTCGGSGTVTRSVACTRCGGSGVDPDGGVCTLCGGRGSTSTSVTCSTCGGSGKVTCPTCGGSGKITALLMDHLVVAFAGDPSTR